MKTFLKKAGNAAILFFCGVIALVVCMAGIVVLPLDYIRFLFSPFHRETKAGYKFLIGFSPYYKLYNLIRVHRLPIEYISSVNQEPFGYFLQKNVLILPDNYDLSYREDEQVWMHQDQDDWIKIEDTVNGILSEFTKESGMAGCKAVVLVDRTELHSDLRHAESNDLFLLYNGKKDLINVLKNFIADPERSNS